MRDWSPAPAAAGLAAPLQAAWPVWPLACPRRRKTATCFARQIRPVTFWNCWPKRPWVGICPIYRGNLSAPLDARWLRGGWTSHFVWAPAESGVYLDVFGVAPRGSSPWETEIQGFYASPHTVAEMKRTNRDKDWPFVTALGARMIERGDERGWLHIYDEKLLLTFGGATKQAADLFKRRPVLELAASKDPNLRPALRAEIEYWHELDRARMSIYERAVRRYMVEVRKSRLPPSAGLFAQHDLRVRCAERHLPMNPLRDFGVIRMISAARETLAQIIQSSRHGVVARCPRTL